MKLHNIKLVVFDLDGTLIDSDKSIYKSTVKSLEKFGIEFDIPPDKFSEMIGLHFQEIFNKYKIKVHDFEEFIEYYKSIYFEFINFSEVYPDVIQTLDLLKDKYIIALLTTKGQDQAEKILQHFNLIKYFDYVWGRKDGLPVKPSSVPLLQICSKFNVEPKDTIIIGDAEIDVQCGKNAGAKTCAVTYGYRKKEKLLFEKPDFIVDNLYDINNFLI
ncbi:MAG: HAD-IA family hydrolase [Ignavibacteriales bacterium]|nr:HAD-IA family hydrolase [Ignavibacteriales bacterium]